MIPKCECMINIKAVCMDGEVDAEIVKCSLCQRAADLALIVRAIRIAYNTDELDFPLLTPELRVRLEKLCYGKT